MAEKKNTAKASTKTAAKTSTTAKVKTAEQEKEAVVENTVSTEKKEPAVKKTAAKKPAAKKTAKAGTETKKETTVKAETKKTAAAKTAKTTKTGKETKKAAAKPAAKKTAAAAKPVAAPKATSKKAKMEQYQSFSMDSCIAMMQAMGVTYTYDMYAAALMDEADLKKIEKKIIDDFKLSKDAFNYDDDGYDLDLVMVVLEKIAETVDFKASDYPKMEEALSAAIAYEFGNDLEKDGEEYLNEFHLCERLLMIAQRQNLRDGEQLNGVIKVDLNAFFQHFMQLARAVLPNWQYNDVKYFEDFAYAVLSQFSDLFASYNNELLMNVADLYILHEDYAQGDADYGYLIRENQIKDYVYYRYAHIYEDIDLDKAKGIAYESLQYVDGRYDYYQPIIDILNR